MTIPTALIVMVLDRSGSMENIRDDTIGGINAFLEEQKKVPGKCLFTLVQFDTAYELVHHNLPLEEVKPLTRDSFVPRGNTALLDAMGRTLNTVETDLIELEKTPDGKPQKIYFTTVTDGAENASREFSRDQIFKMITDRRQNSAWEFIFLASNQDAIAVGQSYGVSMDSSLTFNNGGTRGSYVVLCSNVTSSRSTGQGINFSAQDRGTSMGQPKIVVVP